MKKLFFLFLILLCFDSIAQNSYSVIYKNVTKVDTLYRTLGKDSIQFYINGRYHAIKDSIGGAGGLGTMAYSDSVNFNPKSYFLKGMAALGNDTKASPIVMDMGDIGGNSDVADERLFFMAVWLPQAATITGVTFYLTNVNTAPSTATYSGVGLYTFNGTNLILVDSSTSATDLWTGALGWRKKAFTQTYAAQPGLYFIAFASNNTGTATAAPNIGSQMITAGIPLVATNVRYFGSVTITTPGIPTSVTMSTLTSTETFQYYVALY